jgi:hypothetical protein
MLGCQRRGGHVLKFGGVITSPHPLPKMYASLTTQSHFLDSIAPTTTFWPTSSSLATTSFPGSSATFTTLASRWNTFGTLRPLQIRNRYVRRGTIGSNRSEMRGDPQPFAKNSGGTPNPFAKRLIKTKKNIHYGRKWEIK